MDFSDRKSFPPANLEIPTSTRLRPDTEVTTVHVPEICAVLEKFFAQQEEAHNRTLPKWRAIPNQNLKSEARNPKPHTGMRDSRCGYLSTLLRLRHSPSSLDTRHLSNEKMVFQ